MKGKAIPIDQIERYNLTGLYAATGQTSPIWKKGNLCIMNINMAISRLPANTDTRLDHRCVIGTIPDDVLPDNANMISTVHFNKYGVPRFIGMLNILTDGTVVCYPPSNSSYETDMSIRGEVVWFAVN